MNPEIGRKVGSHAEYPKPEEEARRFMPNIQRIATLRSDLENEKVTTNLQMESALVGAKEAGTKIYFRDEYRYRKEGAIGDIPLDLFSTASVKKDMISKTGKVLVEVHALKDYRNLLNQKDKK